MAVASEGPGGKTWELVIFERGDAPPRRSPLPGAPMDRSLPLPN
jgi:hypothetical protein